MQTFRHFLWTFFLASFFFTSCQQGEPASEPAGLSEGTWRATLTNGSGKEVPFNFEIRGDTMLIVTPKIDAPNDTIVVNEWTTRGDTAYTFRMPVFDAEIRTTRQDDGSLNGSYHSFSNGGERVLAFRATPDTEYRFSSDPKTEQQVAGRWATTITHEGDTKPAIGVFEQDGAQVTGTFLTKTGDYRFLAGQLDGSDLRLSAFDGEHIFLFEATLETPDSLGNGHFYSGKGYHATWTGQRNDTVSLPDPETLTYLKEGVEQFSFRFPNLSGDTVSLDDEKFQDKVVIVQILGSWCPNCMDETQFLAPFYRAQKAAGKELEIIGLAFERTDNDVEKARQRVRRLQERFDIGYPLLLAGLSADKSSTSGALPQLSAVLSYPTTIFLDKQGAVHKIHTGFSGPATGAPYEEWVAEFEETVATLLAEE